MPQELQVLVNRKLLQLPHEQFVFVERGPMEISPDQSANKFFLGIGEDNSLIVLARGFPLANDRLGCIPSPGFERFADRLSAQCSFNVDRAGAVSFLPRPVFAFECVTSEKREHDTDKVPHVFHTRSISI